MIQVSAPEEMRGRISSLTMLYPAFISVGAFLAGPLSDLLGVRGASLSVAAAAGAITLIMLVFMPSLRELRHK
jgi:MFS family permease